MTVSQPFTLPGAAVERRTMSGSHHYYINGYGPLLGASTYLGIFNKPGLVPWARNMALENVRRTLSDHLLDPSSFEVFAWANPSTRAEKIQEWLETPLTTPEEAQT